MAPSESQPVRVASCALEFATASGLGSFLLTCLELPEFSRGSRIFEDYLRTIYLRPREPRKLHVRVKTAPQVLRTLMQIAAANGGEVRKLREMVEEYVQTDIPGFLGRVDLQDARAVGGGGRMLVALWDCNSQMLRNILLEITGISPGRCEVAFVNRGEAGLPTHLIRLQDIQHGDAVLSWLLSRKIQIEVYQPYSANETGRFWVRRGHRFPMPGLDALSDVPSELILLRPRDNGKTEWLIFEEGQLNFFRKIHEIMDAQVGPSPLVAIPLREGNADKNLPMELAIVKDEGDLPMRLWELDKRIDHERQKLNELERRRRLLAADKLGDVYFAYRFTQGGDDRLNALLVRFLQQRLSVLASYEYAYCEPTGGAPFHLVIAQRTQRQLGFGIQLADAVYYLPQEFRRWGVNLYLPIGRQLAPAPDTSDAVPLLQRLLEKGERPEAMATLWDELGEGRIGEIRVAETRPLLSEFRVLNSFQRLEARQIAQRTRQALIAGLEKARADVAATCQDMGRDVLTFIAAACEEIETTYASLQFKVRSAKDDLAAREPRVTQVTQFVERIPKTWADFVAAVVGLSHEFAKDAVAAHKALRQEYVFGGQELRAIAACHRDLTAQMDAWRDKLSGDYNAITTDLGTCQKMMEECGEIASRMYDVCVEIRKAYDRLADRLAAIEAKRQQAAAIEAEIDAVETREREVQVRLERLKVIREQMREREEKLKQLLADTQAKETDCASRGAELALAEEQAVGRLCDVRTRLADLEGDLHRIVAESAATAELFEAVEDESSLLRQRAAIVDQWQQHSSRWSQYLETEHRRLGGGGPPAPPRAPTGNQGDRP
jgi:hypothetical protein